MKIHRKTVSQAAIGLSLGALFLGACDTTAFVSPKIRRLSDIRSTGAIGAACNLTQPERDYLLRFVPISTDSQVIEPGERLVGFTVDLGVNFTARDLEVLGRTGRLHPVPDVACATNNDCTAAGLADFTCEPLADASSGATDIPRVCGRQIGVEIDTNTAMEYVPRLPAEDNRRRSIVTMFYNGDSVIGRCPDTGRIEAQRCRLDRNNQRLSGFTQQMLTLFSANSRFNESIQVCSGTYRAGQTTFVENDNGQCFRSFPGTRGLTEYFAEVQQIAANGLQNAPMDYFQGIRDGLAQFRNGGQPNADRHLVIYVDQAIVDTRVIADNNAFNINVDSVLAEALDLGVTIHAIQLDPVGSPFGRSGPLSDLARLSCETGGTFRYVENPTTLSDAFSSLGFGIPSSYEALLRLSTIGDVPRGPYKLATTITVRVGTSVQTYPFGGYVGVSSGRVDRRLQIQLNGCVSADQCLDGYGCSNGICQANGDFGGGPAPTPEPAPEPDPTPEPEEEAPSDEE